MMLLPLLFCFADAGEIMARVAENQNRAETMRTAFVFHQSVLIRLQRTNGKLAREEYSEFTVAPAPKGVKRERTLFHGKYLEHGKEVTFEEPGWEHKGVDIDADLAKDFADDFAGDKESRDGLNHDLFPLTSAEQARYKFTLEGVEDYRGMPVYRVTFVPKRASPDDDNGGSIWAGEVLVHRDEYQPVLITTRQAAKVPLAVKMFLGTDVQQLGFKVTYHKFDEDLWFPVTYGGEFKLKALFLYGRRIGISVQNSGFQKAQVESKINFAEVH